MTSLYNPGKDLYDLYRKEPPTHGGSSHRCSYFDGYEGRPNKFAYAPTSYGYWAWKAGHDNKAAELLAL